MAGPRAIDALYGCCPHDGHATSVRNRTATEKGPRVTAATGCLREELLRELRTMQETLRRLKERLSGA